MNTQPEALRLAKMLEQDPRSKSHHAETAAELRRLSAENERIGPLAERVLELKAQRDALLKALKEAAEALQIAADNAGNFYQWVKEAHAAIKSVEEGE